GIMGLLLPEDLMNYCSVLHGSKGYWFRTNDGILPPGVEKKLDFTPEGFVVSNQTGESIKGYSTYIWSDSLEAKRVERLMKKLRKEQLYK
ncbi:MAG: hypothetical protein WCI43_04420, partial [Candidatus Firestonebacteria bacterium]